MSNKDLNKKISNLQEEKVRLERELCDVARSELSMSEKISELSTKIEVLEDENKLVWFMLDEERQSQKWTKEHSEALEKSINEKMAMLQFMQNAKGEA
jgi:septal ring factor EnvC (AmiA/AmiB activator)